MATTDRQRSWRLGTDLLRRTMGVLVAGLVLLCVGLVGVVGAATITEFDIPMSSPGGITAGPDGALWFTEENANTIGRITIGGTITQFSVPTSNSGLEDITAGPDGALWFTEKNGSKIGRITTAGTITEFTIPPQSFNLSPWEITAGPDGALWFTVFNANMIGRISTAGIITEFTTPALDSRPLGITAGPDGALWFTDSNRSRIGRMTTTRTVTEFPLPTATSYPGGITAGPDGALWFTEQHTGKIGRITTAGTITEFTIPTLGNDPLNITAGPDGALWFTEFNVRKIGHVTTAGVISELSVPSGSHPIGITAGPDGAIWFTEVVGSKIGRITTAPGDLDLSFGIGGKVTTDFGAGGGAAALALQPDGKIVAAGGGSFFDTGVTLVRYNPDGSLDPTFGSGGKVTTHFRDPSGNSLSSSANALALQPDGKIVAAGNTFIPCILSCSDTSAFNNFALARYNPDGSLDPTFGSGGKVTTDFGGPGAFATALAALALQPDGKIVAAGEVSSSIDFRSTNFALARYNPDGSLDPTFGTGGKVTTDFGGGDGAATLAVQPDGKIVAAGEVSSSIDFFSKDFALARYNPDGSLDPTFGTGGKVTTDFGAFDRAASLGLQANGKIVVAGLSDPGGASNFALARYNPDGSLDPTFGTGGKVTTDFGGSADVAHAVALQLDGKIVVAGNTNGPGFINSFGLGHLALARYEGDPTPAALFIARLYQQVLNRDPDPAGLQAFLQQITQFGSVVPTVLAFFHSPEFLGRNTTNAQFLTICYHTFLDREPDQAGFTAFLADLQSGLRTRDNLIDIFLDSQEFANLASFLPPQDPVTAFVTNLYVRILGRGPDLPGLQGFVTQLQQTRTVLPTVVNFLHSPEFLVRNTNNTEYVTVLYRVFLDRVPDAAGLAGWVALLTQGSATRDQLAAQFAASAEFQAIQHQLFP